MGAPALPGDPAATLDIEGVGERAGTGVLLSHGFTGMPGSIHPWALAVAAEGYSVRVPLLPGHGTHWRELNRTTFDDWVAEITRQLSDLAGRCDRVVLGGLSMGGTVTLRAAQLFPRQVAGLMLVNPSVMSRRKELTVLPVLKHLTASVAAIGGDINKTGVVEPAYPRTPLKALDTLRRGWSVVRRDLPTVTAPLLLMHSRVDNVVEPENSAIILKSIGSTDVTEVWLDRSRHVATLDNDADVIATQSLAFLDRISAP